MSTIRELWPGRVSIWGNGITHQPDRQSIQPAFETDESQQVYDRLWAEASASLATGIVKVDPHLQQLEGDRRRGISLIARPGPEVSQRFSALLDLIRQQEPDQYFYRPGEFHVTVMTLISASAQFDLAQAAVATYHSVFARLFNQCRPFFIRFRGLTASPAAVLAQGYADDNYVNQLRAAIRRELRPVGLAGSLDVRYRIVTSHVTLVRFRSQPCDSRRLLALLSAARRQDFGATQVSQVDFVENDWYMSQDKVRVLQRYPLRMEPGVKLG